MASITKAANRDIGNSNGFGAAVRQGTISKAPNASDIEAWLLLRSQLANIDGSELGLMKSPPKIAKGIS